MDPDSFHREVSSGFRPPSVYRRGKVPAFQFLAFDEWSDGLQLGVFMCHDAAESRTTLFDVLCTRSFIGHCLPFAEFSPQTDKEYEQMAAKLPKPPPARIKDTNV